MKFQFNKAPAQQAEETTETPAAQAAPTSPPQSSGGFLMTGKAAQEAAKKNSGGSGPMRFFIPTPKGGQEAAPRIITFLSGGLDPNGVLDAPAANEHTVQVPGGKWDNFICQKYRSNCPICEQGENPSFSTFLFVIDHTEFTRTDGSKDGFTQRLFVAKPTTRAQLQEYATEYGGLIGQTFKVKRSLGDKVPRVGDVFIPQGKIEMSDLAEAMQALGISEEDVVKRLTTPELEEVLQNLEESDLRSRGFGGQTMAAPQSAAGAGLGAMKAQL